MPFIDSVASVIAGRIFSDKNDNAAHAAHAVGDATVHAAGHAVVHAAHAAHAVGDATVHAAGHAVAHAAHAGSAVYASPPNSVIAAVEATDTGNTVAAEDNIAIVFEDDSYRQLKTIAANAGISEVEALKRALTLMEVAIDARSEDKSLAIIDKDENVSTRITGLLEDGKGA
ncbi:MAG: hypothetical protein AAF810_02440 [Cyanobacteria bacterium P01_D01_bin.36]